MYLQRCGVCVAVRVREIYFRSESPWWPRSGNAIVEKKLAICILIRFLRCWLFSLNEIARFTFRSKVWEGAIRVKKLRKYGTIAGKKCSRCISLMALYLINGEWFSKIKNFKFRQKGSAVSFN